MCTVHGRGADLTLFFRFGHGPILVQINLQHSQAQPYGICNSNIVIAILDFSLLFLVKDRAERHDLKTRLILFPFSLPSPPQKKEVRRKGERITKIVILSHAFLLDPSKGITLILLCFIFVISF